MRCILFSRFAARWVLGTTAVAVAAVALGFATKLVLQPVGVESEGSTGLQHNCGLIEYHQVPLNSVHAIGGLTETAPAVDL